MTILWCGKLKYLSKYTFFTHHIGITKLLCPLFTPSMMLYSPESLCILRVWHQFQGPPCYRLPNLHSPGCTSSKTHTHDNSSKSIVQWFMLLPFLLDACVSSGSML
ncbi:hypothetical protein Bca4012_003213 [Brassica carinata]